MQSIFVLYTEWSKLLKSLKTFILTEFLTNDYLKQRMAPANCNFWVIIVWKQWRLHWCDFYARNTPRTQYLSRHIQNYACSFNQSNDRNFPMRYIIYAKFCYNGTITCWPGGWNSSFYRLYHGGHQISLQSYEVAYITKLGWLNFAINHSFFFFNLL